ncbi:hypothetical protein EU527_08970 [Candidatus Thorarchaeota archaeon]|nr:MAG: hypothetical protein EU527_08970 [Candidatus Thorarchaeota archaeon]
MEVDVDYRDLRYIVYDTRHPPEKDAIYTAAIGLADEIMDAIGRLERSGTIETVTLFITHNGAQLHILTRSFDNVPIDKMFASSLKRSSFESDSGYIQTYVIPLLDSESL